MITRLLKTIEKTYKHINERVSGQSIIVKVKVVEGMSNFTRKGISAKKRAMYKCLCLN